MKTLGIAILVLIAFFSGGCSIYGFWFFYFSGYFAEGEIALFDPVVLAPQASGYAISALCVFWIVRIRRSARRNAAQPLRPPPAGEAAEKKDNWG